MRKVAGDGLMGHEKGVVLTASAYPLLAVVYHPYWHVGAALPWRHPDAPQTSQARSTACEIPVSYPQSPRIGPDPSGVYWPTA